MFRCGGAWILEKSSCSMSRVKKTKAKTAKAISRGGTKPKSIDEYLGGVPEPGRNTLKKMRAAIRSAAPPGTTEIISYGIPAFKYKEVLVWIAAFADHCSLFPKADIIGKFRN